jgi:hypothetical protein
MNPNLVLLLVEKLVLFSIGIVSVLCFIVFLVELLPDEGNYYD